MFGTSSSTPKKEDEEEGDSSLEVVIGLVMLMKTTTTSSGIAGGGDGKRKDAEVAKWDEGEGSEEKKVGAWASSSSSRSPREFRSLCHMSSLDFCQSSVGVKEGKKSRL